MSIRSIWKKLRRSQVEAHKATAKVCLLIDNQVEMRTELILNKGGREGVQRGDLYALLDGDHRVGAILRVISVQEKFCTAVVERGFLSCPVIGRGTPAKFMGKSTGMGLKNRDVIFSR